MGTRNAAFDIAVDVDPLEETERLVHTAGARVVARVAQNVKRPDPATLLGRGKVAELAESISQHGADCAIFDRDLSPAQIGTVENEVGVKVLDRTDLILAIFAQHARTREARLQVELAQLVHLAPRLAGRWAHLNRQHGGIGARGPGETQLETDRRLVRTRIAELRRRIKDVARQRVVSGARRRAMWNAVLVGYTNAGKSTLLNALTGSQALVADRLFSTLDALTRRLTLPSGRVVLLSDTVGFIEDLPAELVASFHSTLAEAASADLLLAVTDLSHHGWEHRLAVVDETLERIGAAGRPRLIVFNKVDAVQDEIVVQSARTQRPEAVFISAEKRWGLSTLKERLEFGPKDPPRGSHRAARAAHST